MLDILVLLLNNFIAGQHDEVLLINDCVEKLDQRPRIVQVGCVELGRQILLNLKKLHLGVIDALRKHK